MAASALSAVDVLAPAFRRLARAAAAVVVLIGVVVAAGWALHVEALRDVLPASGASMKPNVALGFIFGGAALWLLQAPDLGRARRISGMALAAAVGVLGALTLFQDVASVDLNIDQLVLADEPWAPETGAPGRMSPNASLALMLAGASLLLLPTRGRPWASVMQLLATVVAATGLLAVLGYLYDIEGLHRLEYGVTGIALVTALTFIVLGLGLLCAAPDRGWMTVFAGATFGGFVARRLLPALTVVIILLGWLRLMGELGNLYGAPLGTALFALATILLLGGLTWHISVALHRSDLKRLAAQRELLEQREWLTTTLLSIGDAVVTSDDRGRTVLMNGVAERLTGWSSEEAAGRPVSEVFRIVNENTGEPMEDPVVQVLRDGNVVALANHTSLVQKDGRLIPIQDSAAPIREDNGRLVGVVLVFRDVSRARRAEQELRASEAVKGAIIGNSLDGIVTIDEEGLIVEFNPAAERIFGYRREEVLGRQMAEMIIPPSHRERHYAGMARLAATGEGSILGRHLELPALRSDGSEFPVELAITPIRTGGRPMFAGHLRDITERKRIERALEQRADQQRAVVRLGQMALRERDLQKVLQQGTATLAATLGIEFSKVLELQPGGDQMVLRAGVGWDEALIGTALVPAGPDTQAGSTVRMNTPLVVEDLPADTRFTGAPLLHEHQIVSGISCTIVGPGGEPWGVLGAHSTRRRAFTEDDISFLGAVANVLANAIERAEAEASLRRSERLYRGIGESMDYGVWVCAPDGRALYSSPSFQRMTGLTLEEASGFGWGAALHPDEVEGTLRAWQETVANGAFWEREHRYRGVDGQWHYVLARGVPIRDDDGDVIYWAGINLDIDNFKRTEEALRRSEERFREIAETIREVFYVIEEGSIRYVSSAYEAVWGRRREELFRDSGSFLESLVEEDRPRMEEAMRRRLAGEATDLEYRIHRGGDGEERWIHDRSFPIRGKDGQVLRIVGVANDVTERKRHEEQMRAVMGELNHRVKNTLAVIQSIALQTARRAPNLAAFQKSFQDRLLAMANAHSLLTQTQWEGAALRDIVNSELEPRVAALEQYRASGPNVRLRPKAALALHMVIHELATNAGKYGALLSDQGRVDVTWEVWERSQPREVVLTWAESSPTPITEPAESGYGTKLVDQLIAYELDGQVEREYRPEGLRCLIRFGLSPRDVAASPPPSPPRGGAPPACATRNGEHCRILVVEDNSMLAMTLCDQLEEAGFTVVGPAGSLARAMALLDGGDIDAAVLDVDLDGTAVYPLARRLREGSIPFILVTGYEGSDLPPDLRDAPMLRKPAEADHIRAFLERELRPV